MNVLRIQTKMVLKRYRKERKKSKHAHLPQKKHVVHKIDESSFLTLDSNEKCENDYKTLISYFTIPKTLAETPTVHHVASPIRKPILANWAVKGTSLVAESFEWSRGKRVFFSFFRTNV